VQSTPASLLQRLRRPAGSAAWAVFVRRYTPLLYAWARRSALPDTDAAELLQDVFATLSQQCRALSIGPPLSADPSRAVSWGKGPTRGRKSESVNAPQISGSRPFPRR
jgi:hypothetical protein